MNPQNDNEMTDVFFLLLRSGLFGTPIAADELPAAIDWDAVLTAARQQTVAGLVADAVARLPRQARPPQDVERRLQAFVERNTVSHMLLNRTLAETVALMEAHGIRTVLLKGQGIARCYREPKLRQCGDIDLYVGREQYARACRLALRELHNRPDQRPEESGKHYGVHRGRIHIELHRIAARMFVPWHDRRLQRWMEAELTDGDALCRAEFFGQPVALPSADFNALFIFLHLLQHFLYGGVGLRQLCDWAMLLHTHAAAIDREALHRRLRQLGLLRLWQTLGYVLVARLGLPESEMPFYADCRAEGEKALARILRGGNFGRYDAHKVRNKWQLQYFLRKLVSLGENTYHFFAAFRYAPLESVCHYLSYIGERLGILVRDVVNGTDVIKNPI